MKTEINTLNKQLKVATGKIDELNRAKNNNSDSVGKLMHQQPESEKLDRYLIDRQDQFEDHQDNLEKAWMEIRDLQDDKNAMSAELEIAEQLINEQVDKIQEQSQLIENLRMSYQYEASEKQKLLRQIQQKAIEAQIRERSGE